MASGKEIETRGHITGFREEIAKAAAEDDDLFFTWFDTARNVDASFVRGEWDFALHIIPLISEHICKPEEKVVLEIGYGGGRILAAASRAFSRVIGVDIHDRHERVGAEFRLRGIGNFRLMQCDGSTLPCPDASIDVAYSFIVFQHLERMAVWQSYIRECHRVLKPGGVAMLYFGRWAPLSLNRPRPWAYCVERIFERFLLPRGFREMPACVNDTNLVVTLPYATEICRKAGFKVCRATVSRKRVPDGLSLYGSQHGLLLKK